MSASGSTYEEFGGEKREFVLAIGDLRRLQELTARGPQRVLTDLKNGDWLVDDIRHTIRLGLEGAGVDPKEATSLIKRYLEERAAWLSVGRYLAMTILLNALESPEDDPPKK